MPDDNVPKEEIKKIVEEVLAEEGLDAAAIDQRRLQKCVVGCTNAHNVAVRTEKYCLDMGGKFSDLPNFNKIVDCAEICEVAASLLLRESDLSRGMLSLAVRACKDCAEFCEQFSDDPQMQACAKYARACVEECGQI